MSNESSSWVSAAFYLIVQRYAVMSCIILLFVILVGELHDGVHVSRPRVADLDLRHAVGARACSGACRPAASGRPESRPGAASVPSQLRAVGQGDGRGQAAAATAAAAATTATAGATLPLTHAF